MTFNPLTSEAYRCCLLQ